MQMQIEQQSPKNQVVLRSFNEIEIQPSPIHSLFYAPDDNNLYVSRQKSTEVYNTFKTPSGELSFNHIATLPQSKYALKVNSILMLFCPFELRTFSNNSWQIHPFTTQLLSINVKKISQSLSIVYSFHMQEAIQYKVSNTEDDQDLVINFLTKAKTPFHVTKQNIVEGFGKKIGSSNKTASFTICDHKTQGYLVIGDSDGSIHIYDFITLGHLKSFKKHLGPILTIKIDQQSDTIYYSGSDSKIVAIRKVNHDWVLVGELRGQSHDIFSLQLIGNTLISGGLTTDICCYPIKNAAQILSTYQNKISYHSHDVIHSIKNYLLINKLISFELWKIKQNEGSLQLLLRYQMPTQKFIKDIKISKKLNQKTYLIVLSTEIDTVGWKFDQINGLVKMFTIKNCYDFIEFLPAKNIFVGLTDAGVIQKVNCNTGKVDQIIDSFVSLPTDMKLIKHDKIIVASNLSNQVKVFDLKNKAIISRATLNKIYQVICQKNENQFLIKYVGDRNLYSCNFSKKSIEETPLLQLPSQSDTLRYGGVIVHQSQLTKKLKKYWYFASENKIFLVNNLNNSTKKKSIRSIFTRQIGTIVKPKLNKSFEIGMVHLNFRRMINNMEIKPLIAKKIV